MSCRVVWCLYGPSRPLGSGKTLAFLVPLVERLYRAGWGKCDGVGAIIISPTRELAVQVRGLALLCTHPVTRHPSSVIRHPSPVTRHQSRHPS